MAEPVPELELEDADGAIWPLEFPGRYALEVSGLGMPPIRHWTTRSPFQHGRTHWGYALQPRVVNLVLYSKGECRQGMWDLRRETCGILSPLPGALKLRLTYPNGRAFEVHDVWYVGGYELSSADQARHGVQVGGVQLECQDPIWKESLQSYALDSTLFDEEPQLVLPFSGPFYLGVTLYTYTTPPGAVVAEGNWPAYPIVIVTGPLEDWSLTNYTNGKQIAWDGYAIAAGEVVTLDIGAHTVTNGAGTSLVNYVSGDFGTFSLDGGENILYFQAVGGVVAGVTGVAITWYNQWLGL